MNTHYSLETLFQDLKSDLQALESDLQEKIAHRQQQCQLEAHFCQGIEQLEDKAQQIRELAQKIETEMLIFKQLTVKVNQIHSQLQSLPEYHPVEPSQFAKSIELLQQWEVNQNLDFKITSSSQS